MTRYTLKKDIELQKKWRKAYITYLANGADYSPHARHLGTLYATPKAPPKKTGASIAANDCNY